ncbi:MAG: hypothetical protein GZ091_08670 [Paludibacter sp.]|nr:hypothetical protein [Paludibacter sp.]
MKRNKIIVLFFLLSLIGFANNAPVESGIDRLKFQLPTNESGPYVWFHWMGYNINEDGITKDLESMKSSGIAGATLFQLLATGSSRSTPIKNVYQDNGVSYYNEKWWSLMLHTAKEAKRLGLKIGMHNCAGWSMSGGPWITAEKSMQKVVWTETKLNGPTWIVEYLQKPQTMANYYQDIAVLLVPKGEVSLDKIIDVTHQMDKNGKLCTQIPDGEYSVYRFGHTSTGKAPLPIPEDLDGLEADKMSPEVMGFHMQNVLNPLKKHLGEYLGSTFNHLLFDSYEAGNQNWTRNMKAEFQNRKGYDIIPWLPVLAGRVIESASATENFKRDFETAISEMYIEYSYKLPRKMMNQLGLGIHIEPYNSNGPAPFNSNDLISVCDLPMTEFWSHQTKMYGEYVGAAAAYFGKPILGAEAFTGNAEYSRWNETPAMMKLSGDMAFAKGINRLILHHWVHQPFPDSIKPGMSMGRWGSHFGRNQTWFEPGKAWITYLSRCQYLLQKGERVADFVALEEFVPGGDLISENTLITNTKVVNGKIISPSGRSYAMLVLPKTKQLAIETIKAISALVYQGAIVYGDKPTVLNGSKSKLGYDEEVKKLLSNLWNTADTLRLKENAYGKGKVVWGRSIPEVLLSLKMKPEVVILKSNNEDAVFWNHRIVGDNHIFYFTNTQSASNRLQLQLRVSDKRPEIWNPETGEIQDAPMWQPTKDGIRVGLSLKGHQSLFIVFKENLKRENFIREIKGSLPDSVYSVAQTATNEWSIHSWAAGSFEMISSKGKKLNANISSVPQPLPISGKWDVRFLPLTSKAFKSEFQELKSLTQSANDSIKYFSGTAVYDNQFDLSCDLVNSNTKVVLNLGVVKDLAAVYINDQFVSVLWHSPFLLDITKQLRIGQNSISVAVTNTWANRIIGDNQFPDDCEWGIPIPVSKTVSAGSSLLKFPDWLQKGERRVSEKRSTFSTWNYFTSDSPLNPAGLIGDVKLEFYKIEKFK